MLNRLKDVFESFQQHNVRYVVIGGIAAVLYGVPRATFDPKFSCAESRKRSAHFSFRYAWLPFKKNRILLARRSAAEELRVVGLTIKITYRIEN